MIRCTTFLALAACVMAAPGDAAAQSYPGPGNTYPASGGEGGYGNGGDTGAGGGSARAVELVLTASGIPFQNGQVSWPLALRLLGTDLQLRQLEAQLKLAAEQVTAGGANAMLLGEIQGNAKELRRLLLADKERRFSLSGAAYEEAERFLEKLRRAPNILAASTPAGRGELTTR